MAIKIDFGAKDSGMKESNDLAAHNEDEVAKMNECISHIEAGEAERAIPILKSLISGEDEETRGEDKEPKEMEKQEKVMPFPGLMKK